MARRLAAALERRVHQLRVGASIGVVHSTTAVRAPESDALLHPADAATYRAKRNADPSEHVVIDVRPRP